MFIYATCITGIFVATAYKVSASTENKVEPNNEDQNKTPKKPICKVNLKVNEITYETLNNTKHPDYIGDRVIIDEGRGGRNIIYK
jgi:hypothetical protein